jgi:signal transduction histidine kinase
MPPRALSVLLVEDNPGDAALIQHHIKRFTGTRFGGIPEVTAVTNLTEALTNLGEGEFDAVVLDLGLPESTGLDTLEYVVAADPDVAVVVLTGLDDDALSLAAIQRGAGDYLTKHDIDPDSLVRSLRYAVERKRNELKLRRQNERLEEFASIVSHDLRNPLTVAIGHLTLARDECESPHLDSIAQAQERMSELIEDLLTLARQGETVDQPKPTPLAPEALKAWTMVSGGILDLDVDAEMTVDCDPERLRTLLENLFRNSIEHGGEDVTVTVGTLDDGFYVADDGPGIPPERREAVFASGFTSNPEGTGFGLAIVSAIADAHGWTVEATESEAGGACFKVRQIQLVPA